MPRDCHNDDLVLSWTIMPENPVSSRSLLFRIGHVDLLPGWTFEAGELMRLKAVVPWIGGQQMYCFLYRFVPLLERHIRLEMIEISLAAISPEYVKQR